MGRKYVSIHPFSIDYYNLVEIYVIDTDTDICCPSTHIGEKIYGFRHRYYSDIVILPIDVLLNIFPISSRDKLRMRTKFIDKVFNKIYVEKQIEENVLNRLYSFIKREEKWLRLRQAYAYKR